jgi:hypothetical protein
MEQSPSWEVAVPQLVKKYPALYGTWKLIKKYNQFNYNKF